MCICGKYKKFKNPKISNIFEKTLALSIICSKCDNEDEEVFKEEDEKIFKEEDLNKILNILDLIKDIKLF